MRKFAVLVAALATMAVGAGPAMAFDNVSVGDPVVGTNVGGISLGTFITCNSSTVSGTVGTDNGSDLGGSGPISSATFTNCGTGNSATANNLPWSLSIDGSGNASISNIDVTVVVAGGLVTCRYTGTISGTYDAADWGGNGDAPLSGSLTRVSGGFPCTATAAVSGTYNVTSNGNVIDL